MNEATKHFFVKIYLQQASSGDYVDWAIACLEDGVDSKRLRFKKIKVGFPAFGNTTTKMVGSSYA